MCADTREGRFWLPNGGGKLILRSTAPHRKVPDPKVVSVCTRARGTARAPDGILAISPGGPPVSRWAATKLGRHRHPPQPSILPPRASGGRWPGEGARARAPVARSGCASPQRAGECRLGEPRDRARVAAEPSPSTAAGRPAREAALVRSGEERRLGRGGRCANPIQGPFSEPGNEKDWPSPAPPSLRVVRGRGRRRKNHANPAPR